MGTPAQNIEKDFWVCWTLDALFNGLPEGHPRLLFKGGTSLSKAYSLISRFSEDIDVTVFRDDIGHAASVEELEALSRKKRQAKLDAIKAACRDYIHDTLFLTQHPRESGPERGWNRQPSRQHGRRRPRSDGQTILFWYQVRLARRYLHSPSGEDRVRRQSALEPHCTVAIRPDVSKEVPGISLEVANVITVLLHAHSGTSCNLAWLAAVGTRTVESLVSGTTSLAALLRRPLHDAFRGCCRRDRRPHLGQ